MGVRPVAAELGQHLPPALLVLVLAHLDLADEALDGQPQPDRARGQPRAHRGVQRHGRLHVALEVVHQPRQHAQVLVGLQDLRRAVAVGDAEVPGGRRACRRSVYQLGDT